MALHPDFPASPHAILEPGVRWFPADGKTHAAACGGAAPQSEGIPRRWIHRQGDAEIRDTMMSSLMPGTTWPYISSWIM